MQGDENHEKSIQEAEEIKIYESIQILRIKPTEHTGKLTAHFESLKIKLKNMTNIILLSTKNFFPL
jgi:hypothetical protein